MARVHLVLLGALLLTPLRSPAQEGPLYPRVFPNPSGTNGMEEIIRAGDLIRASKLIGDCMMPDATLTQKRKALEEPGVRQALLLIRVGLGKPVRPLPFDDDASHTQALALCRNTARALGIEQYVLWADGKTSKALDSMADLLRISYVLGQGSLIGNLVGVAVDGIAIGVARKRLTQLSQPDCAKLKRLAEQWLAMPDPAIAALQAERDIGARKLEPLPNRAAVLALLASRYDGLIQELRKPPWERRIPVFTSGSSSAEQVAAGLWATLKPVYEQVLVKWSHEMATVQLLGVHAAVRDHLWEYGKLPATLEELQLGGLAIDPFTGKSLKYRVTGSDTYELSSEGPYERDAEGNPVGERKPIIF